MSRVIQWLALIIVVGAGIIYYFVFDGSIPKTSEYSFSLDEIRTLAAAPESERPTQIRLEIVSSPRVPCFALRPGCFGSAEMTRGSFQILTPLQTLILETGMDYDLALAHNQHDEFSEAAWNTIQDAMSIADVIIVTHEHPDHIGGIARHRQPASLADKIVLTREQFDALSGFAVDGKLSKAIQDYQPIDLDGPYRIAPGIVMIPAPGHTPGSVIIYVQMDTGREMLFVGDIAFTGENIKKGIDRPRFVRFMMVSPEDRNAVVNQLRTLYVLSRKHPEITIIPAHADVLIKALIDDGTIEVGFKPS